MSTPAIIYIVLLAISGTFILHKHGQTVTYDFTTWLFLSMPLNVGLLYWGGFFS